MALGDSGLLMTNTNTSSNTASGGTQIQQNTGSQMPYFTPVQQMLQGQAGSMAGMLQSGNVPQSFGLPQSVYDAAMFNFNKYQAPQLAAQYGAGSPTINSAMQELQLQLAGQSAQQAMGNYINAYQAAANYAFTPTGSTSTANSNQTVSQQGSAVGESMTNYTDPLSALGTIFNSVGGGVL